MSLVMHSERWIGIRTSVSFGIAANKCRILNTLGNVHAASVVSNATSSLVNAQCSMLNGAVFHLPSMHHGPLSDIGMFLFANGLLQLFSSASIVGGGRDNTATGDYAVIAGGSGNTATSSYVQAAVIVWHGIA